MKLQFEGTDPLEGVSAGVIGRAAIRLAGMVCAQGADWRRHRAGRTILPKCATFRSFCTVRGGAPQGASAFLTHAF